MRPLPPFPLHVFMSWWLIKHTDYFKTVKFKLLRYSSATGWRRIGVEVRLHTFLTRALGGSESLHPGTQRTGGSVGPRTGQDRNQTPALQSVTVRHLLKTQFSLYAVGFKLSFPVVMNSIFTTNLAEEIIWPPNSMLEGLLQHVLVILRITKAQTLLDPVHIQFSSYLLNQFI
jgi:hypothetical protein